MELSQSEQSEVVIVVLWVLSPLAQVDGSSRSSKKLLPDLGTTLAVRPLQLLGSGPATAKSRLRVWIMMDRNNTFQSNKISFIEGVLRSEVTMIPQRCER